jgi:hypothetical protein
MLDTIGGYTMKKNMRWVVVLVIIVLGSCATAPAFNPDAVPEEELITLSLGRTGATQVDTGFAIVGVNGIPVVEETGVVLFESSEHGEYNAIRLPPGTHVITLRLQGPDGLSRRSRYMEQRIDLPFTMDEPGGKYVLSRENPLRGLGDTFIVLRSAGPVPGRPSMFSRRLEEVRLTLTGFNEFEIVD